MKESQTVTPPRRVFGASPHQRGHWHGLFHDPEPTPADILKAANDRVKAKLALRKLEWKGR